MVEAIEAMDIQCLMLCENATHDQYGYLKITRGGLSTVFAHADQFPVPLNVVLAFRATRSTVEGVQDAEVRFNIVDIDGKRVSHFGVDADKLTAAINDGGGTQSAIPPCVSFLAFKAFASATRRVSHGCLRERH